MKAYLEIVKFECDDIITTSTTTPIIPPIIWGDGDTTPPTPED